MATNILMPALSPTMTEGTLARWLKKEGEEVRAGDVIAEIETDKATMEVEAVDEGVLSRILVPDGTAGVKVNATIAVLNADAAAANAPAAGGGETAAAAPTAPPAAPQAKAPEPTPAPSPAVARNGHDAGSERIFASPLARRMAKQAGIDLSALKGSGPNGRIIRADIDAVQRGGTQAAAPSMPAPAPTLAPAQARAAAPPPPVIPAPAAAVPAPAKAAAITAPHTLVPATTMRKVIARRLTESQQQVPSFYLTLDIELDALLKLRSDLNAKSPKADGFKLSVNDLVIKAAAVTLRRVPRMNASYTDDGIAMYHDVDISVAVSIPDGLITPIIRRADQKGLATISREMRELGSRAKAGALKPEEFMGGSFSISNLGMFGTKQFTAIINPPQAAILAVGVGEKRPVVRNDALAVATVMSCTLTVDHRVADGALGAEWMAEFKKVVEDPLSLML